MIRRVAWLVWLLLSLMVGSWLGLGLTMDQVADNPEAAQTRLLFVPGATTSDHLQIEIACEVCHSEAFAEVEQMQSACLKCHEQELKDIDDSHKISLFDDPANAETLTLLDATQCVSCHVEHKPQMRNGSGATLEADFCVVCHDNMGQERESHQGLAADSCASSGCHHYHDNRALYEDFLLKHQQKPEVLERPWLPQRDFVEMVEELMDYPLEEYPLQAQTRAQPGGLTMSPKLEQDWLQTAHAAAGVNCKGCHQNDDESWVVYPEPAMCTRCHQQEVQAFTQGKHGMRLALDLPAITPLQVERPMAEDVQDKPLSCTSCHAAHRFDTRLAAVEGCLGCHADRHSLAYKQSAHYRLWLQQGMQQPETGRGVSCASCHLPRIDYSTKDYVDRILVQHNQSATMRPADKMLRPVCLNCHGLGYSINALADQALIRDNFNRPPAVQVDSIQMAVERDCLHRLERQQRAAEKPRGSDEDVE